VTVMEAEEINPVFTHKTLPQIISDGAPVDERVQSNAGLIVCDCFLGYSASRGMKSNSKVCQPGSEWITERDHFQNVV